MFIEIDDTIYNTKYLIMSYTENKELVLRFSGREYVVRIPDKDGSISKRLTDFIFTGLGGRQNE